MDALDVLGIIFILLNYLIFFPLLIYHLKQFNLHSSDSTIATRDKTFVYAINILALASALIDRPLQLCYRVWLIFDPSNLWITYILSVIILGSLFISFAIKVYHLYFAQQYHTSIADKLWKSAINPNEINWYIAHKSTFGSTWYLIKLAMIPFSVLVVIELVQVLTIGEGPLFVLIHVIVILVPIITSLVLYYKLKKDFEDIYGIKNEIFYQFSMLATGLFLYILTNIIFSNAIDNVRLQWLLIIYIANLFLTLPLAFSSSYYPLYLISKERLSKQTLSSELSMSGQDHLSGKGFSIIKALNQVISEYQSFKTFMTYLVHEFAAENLLYLVELIQIKHEYQTNHNNLIRMPKDTVFLKSCVKEETVPKLNNNTSSLKKKDNSLYQVVDFNVKPTDNIGNKLYTYLFHTTGGSIMTPMYLSPKIPQTVIISEHKNNLFLQMKSLYNKYIRISSVNELNISFDVRESVMNYFETVEQDKDYKVFNALDEVAVEVLRLLQYSFRRFRLSDEFIQMNNPQNGKNNDPNAQSDVGMKDLLNSKKIPVLRNATSYSVLKEQYLIK